MSIGWKISVGKSLACLGYTIYNGLGRRCEGGLRSCSIVLVASRQPLAKNWGHPEGGSPIQPPKRLNGRVREKETTKQTSHRDLQGQQAVDRKRQQQKDIVVLLAAGCRLQPLCTLPARQNHAISRTTSMSASTIWT